MLLRPLACAAAAAALVALAGCAGSPDPGIDLPYASPSAVVATPARAAGAAPVDLLTGTAPRTAGPVIVLKVDNAVLARPYQRGLDRAAIVYQELVEGGLTRFVAVFDGQPDVEVGPVRSLRESDVELLRGYGPVGLGFSGGQPGVLAAFRAASRAGQVRDVSYDALPGAYRLAERRKDARNFFTRPATLARLRPSAAPPRDVGLRFGALPATTGTPVTGLQVRYSRQSVVRVRWDTARRVWELQQDGRTVNDVAPANVVIQRVRAATSRFVDVHGNPTPYTTSTGTGAVTVLRDGRQVLGTWTRPDPAKGTRLLDAKGKDIPLAPGQTWVLLLPTSGSVTPG